jgi:hypothetical protein
VSCDEQIGDEQIRLAVSAALGLLTNETQINHLQFQKSYGVDRRKVAELCRSFGALIRTPILILDMKRWLLWG